MHVPLLEMMIQALSPSQIPSAAAQLHVHPLGHPLYHTLDHHHTPLCPTLPALMLPHPGECLMLHMYIFIYLYELQHLCQNIHIPMFFSNALDRKEWEGMEILWCAKSQLQLEVAYLDSRFWHVLYQLKFMSDDKGKWEYLAMAAEKYRLEYRTTRAHLQHIETAIEAVIEYAFRCHQDLSLPPMS